MDRKDGREVGGGREKWERERDGGHGRKKGRDGRDERDGKDGRNGGGKDGRNGGERREEGM